MAEPKDGGTAFPVVQTVLRERSPYGNEWYPHASSAGGMSLRDYFAGQALTGCLANHDLLKIIDTDLGDRPTRYCVTTYAYAVADSMLAAREVK
jgi:hypothetical protein